MAGCKNKLINIPINDEDVFNTVNNLPRTPREAGLPEVKLKRKLEYKNDHKKEYVNPTKIYKALDFLKQQGHPGYQFYDSISSYEDRCQAEDPVGHKMVFYVEDEILDIEDHFKAAEDSIQDVRKLLSEEDKELLDEIEYIKMDPVRKYQFDYDRSVCLVDKFPEAAVPDKVQEIAFAPGEGKIPENILMTDNWDIDAFPMKHPDGKNGMYQERERKLSDQYYIVQRLRNKDSRFSDDPSYSFACASYLEKKQLQRNVNISFQRGKKTASGSYSLEDGFSVFDKIKNTPTYWRQAKYEMLAKLENLGPFQFFFTLSSADSRWDENFSSLLRNLGVAVTYEMDSKGKEDTKLK